MAEFYDTPRGLLPMPPAVMAADAATRERWLRDPDGVAAQCEAAEAARVAEEFQTKVAEAKRTGAPEPMAPPKPLDPAAQRAMSAAAAAHQDRLEAARLRALTGAPAAPSPSLDTPES